MGWLSSSPQNVLYCFNSLSRTTVKNGDISLKNQQSSNIALSCPLSFNGGWNLPGDIKNGKRFLLCLSRSASFAVDGWEAVGNIDALIISCTLFP